MTKNTVEKMEEITSTNDLLRTTVERIERLEEEKSAIAEDIKEVYSEAKNNGFDTKILKKLVGIRKKDQNVVMEEDILLDTYKRALGMQSMMDDED